MSRAVAHVLPRWLEETYGLEFREFRTMTSRAETVEALKYAAELYKTFIPGTLSWLDTNNNKAFLAGEISLTQPGGEEDLLTVFMPTGIVPPKPTSR